MVLQGSGVWWKALGWLLLFFSAAAGGAVFGQTVETVRFSYGLGREALPAVAAIEEGFFFRQGLNVSGLPVSPMATTIQSLKSGATDFATLPARGLILVGQMRLPVRIVALSGWGLNLEVLVPAAGNRNRSMKDLGGRVIGIDLESEAYPHFIRYLYFLGLPHSGFQFRHSDNAELAEAFTRGRIAAAVVPGNVSQRLVTEKIASRLVSHGEFWKVTYGVNPSALVVRKDFLDTRPQVVERFVRAWAQGLRFSANNLDTASHLLRRFYERQGVNVPVDVVRPYVELARYDRCAWEKADTLDVEYSAWALRQVGIFSETINIAGLVDNRFILKAAPQC